jgi:hypothetical protein
MVDENSTKINKKKIFYNSTLRHLAEGFLYMFNKIKNNKFQFFILKAGVLYGLCYFLYEFIVKRNTRGDQLFIREIINLCKWIFDLMGYKTFASKEVNDFQVFGIDGSNGVWIGGPCNGITLHVFVCYFCNCLPWKY